jgi:hypothetical protein
LAVRFRPRYLMLAEYSIYGGNEILRCDADANLDRQNSDLATEYTVCK